MSADVHATETMTPARLTAAVLIVIALSAVYYHHSVLLLPVGPHTWAEADRLALAMRFLDRGLHLLDPATYSLFDPDGRVAVELPLQAFAAAAVARLVGEAHVSTAFRLLDIVLFAVGVLYLYRLSSMLSHHRWLAVLPPALLATSPLFVYYSGAYLPDPAALSLFLAGLYYFFAALRRQRVTTFAVAMVLLTLAAHVKMSFALYLPGICFHWLWHTLRDGSRSEMSPQKPLPGRVTRAAAGAGIMLMALGSLIAGYLHIKMRQATLGTWTFTTRLHPFEGIDDLATTSKAVLTHHLPRVLHPAVLVLAAALLVLLLVARESGPKRRDIDLQTANASIVSVVLLLILGRQFLHHEYYLFAAGYPAVALALVLCCSRTAAMLERIPRVVRRVVLLSLMCLPVLQLVSTLKVLDQRTGGTWCEQVAVMEGGDALLDSIGVAREEPIVVFQDQNWAGPNLPLVYLRRPGYAVTDAPGLGRRHVEAAEIDRFMRSRGADILILTMSRLTDPGFAASFPRESFTLLTETDSLTVFELNGAAEGT